jgi:hypothetical protein
MPTVYILKCDDSCYYIGKTRENYFVDIDKHFQGFGNEWTKLHKPIRMETLRHFCDEDDDNLYTILYMMKYGINKVRGGSYSQVVLTHHQLFEINNCHIDNSIICSKCGMVGHKSSKCPFWKNTQDNENKESNDIHEEYQTIYYYVKPPTYFQRIIKIVLYPLKVITDKCCLPRRSSSFHTTYPNVFDNLYQSLDN